MKALKAYEYLSSLGSDAIARAYQVAKASYNAAGDEAAALLLQQQAALAGLEVRITGPTLGRFRSTVGLVDRHSPRSTPAPSPAPAPAAQLESSSEDESLSQIYGLYGVVPVRAAIESRRRAPDNKVLAIKVARDCRPDLTLKEAKDMVDHLWARPIEDLGGVGAIDTVGEPS